MHIPPWLWFSLDLKSSHRATQTPETTCTGHSAPDPRSTTNAELHTNHRLEGIKNDDYLISVKEVGRRTGLTRGTVNYLMTTSDFPLPLKLGIRTVRWWSSEIDHWLMTRERAKGDLGKRHDKLESKTE